jgi:type I restriction enzyme S subunit
MSNFVKSTIPPDWKLKKLKDVVLINNENLNLNSVEFIYYIDIAGVNNQTFEISDIKKIPISEIPSRARRIVRNQDVIISTVRPYLQAFTKIPKIYDGYVCSTGFAVLRAKNEINPEYLFNWIFSKPFMNYMIANMVGSNYPAVKKSDVETAPILIPSLKEQGVIASFLGNINSIITTTQQLIDRLQTLKRGLMQRLFTQGIGHTEFQETKLGRIPKGWSITTFSKICKIITKGSTPTSYGFQYQKKGINFLKTEAIDEASSLNPDLFAFIDLETHNFLKRSQLEENDIVFSIAGTIGRVSIVSKEIIPANTNQALCIIRLKESELLKYIKYFLQSHLIQKFIRKITITSAQPNINLNDVRRFLIVIPPKEEREKIIAILENLDNRIRNEKSMLHYYKTMKKGLMQVLLTGEKRVPLS